MTQKFGIFSPVLGVRTDAPNIILSESYMPDAQNVIFRDGGIISSPRMSKYMFTTANSSIEMTSPDSSPFIHLHYHMPQASSSGVDFLLGFTATHVYKWTPDTSSGTPLTTGTWGTAIFTGGSATTLWSSASYGDVVVFTNGIDKIQEYNGTTVSILDTSSGVDVGSEYITKCQQLTVFENYLILAGVTLSVSGSKLSDIYWNVYGDKSDFKGVGSGATTVYGDGIITGMGFFGDTLVIFKERSIFKAWLVEGDAVFNMGRLMESVGTISPKSIFNGPQGELYFWGTDNRIRVIQGVTGDAPPVSDAIEKRIRHLTETKQKLVVGNYNVKHATCFWSFPSETSAVNDTAVCYNDGAWTFCDYGINSFSNNRLGSGTYLTIDQLSGYIDDLTGFIDGEAYNTGILDDIVADTANHVRRLTEETDGSLTSYFVLGTDLTEQRSVHMYKRLLSMRVHYKGQSQGSMNIYVMEDNSGLWVPVGTIDMNSSREIESTLLPCNYRAKYYKIKGESTDDFMFYGIEFQFVMMGER